MKRLISHMLVLMLTFAVGAGLDRLISPRADHASQSGQPVTAIVAEVHESTPAPVGAVEPVATTTTSKLIFDYDPEKFFPEGGYSIIGRKPEALSDFDSFGLGTDIRDGKLTGYITVQTNGDGKYDSQTPIFGLVTEQRLFFVTPVSEEGFEYRFDGEFLRHHFESVGGTDKAVVRGTLTKMKNGRKVAEHIVSFRIEYDAC
ncbi:MAG TPA: hypothetical protein VIG25_21295 [Pyrinomonadaceae bacterium]